MRRTIALLGAIVVGFTGALTLHGSLGPRSTQTVVRLPTTPGSTSPASSGATTTTAVGASTSAVNGSAVGQLENYGYGKFAVKVTVASGRIVGLAVTSLTTLESYSLQLEQQVVPILKNEVLQAQGTRINALSGATYTSEAYAYSVQSALDQLHFK